MDNTTIQKFLDEHDYDIRKKRICVMMFWI